MQEIAEYAGISQQRISYIEFNGCAPENRDRIISAYEMAVLHKIRHLNTFINACAYERDSLFDYI